MFSCGKGFAVQKFLISKLKRMKPLIIEKTNNTLGITLNKENNKFLFEGRSIPENTVEFFKPVLEWLNEYKNSPLEKTTVNMDFMYFNTSTAKLLLDVLLVFDKINTTEKSVEVIWHYMEDDTDIQEAGEEFASMISIDFDYIEHPESYYE